jgi:hypothetical protein
MTVPDPNATTAPPPDTSDGTAPVDDDQALVAQIADHLSSDGPVTDPASGAVPSDEPPAVTGPVVGAPGSDTTQPPAGSPAPAVPFDPFAPPAVPAAGSEDETVDLFGIKVNRQEAEALLSAFQFASSLTPEQFQLLQTGTAPATPLAAAPAGPAPVAGPAAAQIDWEELDPAVAQVLRAQQAELAQLRDAQAATQQAQAVSQYRITVEQAFDRFAQTYGLDQSAIEHLAGRLHRAELMPGLVASQGGDIGLAVEAGLYTMMATDPAYAGRIRTPGSTAAADAEIEARKARASGTASGSGSAVAPVSPLNTGTSVPAPPAGVARTAREARAQNEAQMFRQLADEFRTHLASP